MKNILLIAPGDPRDLSAGGAQRTNFLYEALRREGRVYTLIPVGGTFLEKQDAEWNIAWVCPMKRYSPTWFLDRLLSREVPFLHCPSGGILPQLAQLWPGVKFDYVVCRYAAWAVYTRAWQVAPLLLDVDDLPLESFQTIYASQCRMPAFLRMLVRRWQDAIFRKSAGLWIANAEQLSSLPAIPKGWLPNLPREPEREYSPSDRSRPQIISVGYLGYPANYEGIDTFLTEVWPTLHRNYPQLRYRIIGRELPLRFQERWSAYPNVEIPGFVEDLEEEYRNALFSVAPIYSGSGTCIKVLESLRMGRVCLCTPFAVRGLKDSKLLQNGLLVEEDADAFLKQAVSLLENEPERHRLESAGMAAVQAEFNFKLFSDSVEALIRAVER